MNLELTNLNAVVCGSTQGIGLATAEVLAKLGANIYLPVSYTHLRAHET